jgi:hypothetical protein
MAHGLSKKKSEDKKINKTWTHTPHAHAQTMSSCHQNIVPFDEKGCNYFHYSNNTKKQCTYRWQHCVTIHKITIGGTLNVLNFI